MNCSLEAKLLVLTGFASADLEVRRKAISIVLNMTTSRNVEEVVLFFKKQLQRTQEQDSDKVSLGLPLGEQQLTLVLCHRLRSTGSCSFSPSTSAP